MRLESPSKPYQNGAPAAILFRYGLSCFSNALKINTILLDIFCYEPKKKKEITEAREKSRAFFYCLFPSVIQPVERRLTLLGVQVRPSGHPGPNLEPLRFYLFLFLTLGQLL